MSWTYNALAEAPTDGPLIAGLAITFTVLSFIVVALRLYVRFSIIEAAGADDWAICVAWIGCCGFATVTSLQTRWGLGLLRLDDLPEENIYEFGLLQYAGAPFYVTSIFAFKLSLLLSYLRIIASRGYQWTIFSVIVLCTLFHLSFLIVQINLCQPIALQWDPSLDGTCVEGVPFYLSMASLTISFDILVMLLPFPALIKVRIQKRKKVVLLGLLALGVFITVIQIFRIQTVVRLANYLDSAPLIMWSTIENNLGVIVACVPTLAPLIRYFSDKSSSRGTGSVDLTGDGKLQDNNKGASKRSYSLQSWRGGREQVGRVIRTAASDTASTEMILEQGIRTKQDLANPGQIPQ